jgi:NAD(P)-dependent dehydrogenase (short-subunit alcohol dehydrogenase family)
MPLREEVKALGLEDRIRVERLDLTDPYDIRQAVTRDFDVLWTNAGMGEAGPVWEIPLDLVRTNVEVNVFLPLEQTQTVVQRWVREGTAKRKKPVFTSSMGGLFTPANWGPTSPPSTPSNRWRKRCSRSSPRR